MTLEQKTAHILRLLRQIPEPYSSMAVQRTKDKSKIADWGHGDEITPEDALLHAFAWDDSPEKWGFWEEVRCALAHEDPLPEPPDYWKPTQINGIDL